MAEGLEFGGFPYRSSHQQGQDGRGGGRGSRRNNNRGRGRQSKKSSPVSYYSDLQPLPNQRKLLVGNGGSTIKWLRESTKSNIFIPKKAQNQHPVRVNTSELTNLLHTFSEISYILSQTCDIDDTTTSIPCNVKIRSNNNNNNNSQSNDVKVNGQLLLISAKSAIGNQEDCKEQSLLFRGSFDGSNVDDDNIQQQQQLLVYSMSTVLSEEDVSTVIDNIRFVDASIIDSCQWFYRKRTARRRRGNDDTDDQTTDNTESDRRADNSDTPDQEESVDNDSVILIYGTEKSCPWLICQAIRDANDKH